MMSARRSERFGWPTRSAAVKSFNHRNDSYRNGNAEGHRVDPRGLRGHRRRDGLFSFLASDFPRRPAGRLPTLGVAIGPPPRLHHAFPLAKPDQFLIVDSYADDLD